MFQVLPATIVPGRGLAHPAGAGGSAGTVKMQVRVASGMVGLTVTSKTEAGDPNFVPLYLVSTREMPALVGVNVMLTTPFPPATSFMGLGVMFNTLGVISVP
jgi:hypothetical protein